MPLAAKYQVRVATDQSTHKDHTLTVVPAKKRNVCLKLSVIMSALTGTRANDFVVKIELKLPVCVLSCHSSVNKYQGRLVPFTSLVSQTT